MSAISGERTRLSDSSTAWIRLRRSQSHGYLGGLLQIAQLGSISLWARFTWCPGGGMVGPVRESEVPCGTILCFLMLDYSL
jgi:hypothetical protein